MEDTVPAATFQESEELHRITLLSMSDAVFITNDEGVFTFICPNVDVIFGYGPEEVRAMDRISRLLGRDLIEPGQLAASGEARNIEHEIEAKGGRRCVLLVHVKAVSIKRGTVLYVCRDITERKQAEQALRRNEERLTLALEAATAGTWDWHVPTGEMTWSPETHRMFGDTTGARPPSFDSFLERVDALDRERVVQTMTEAMDRGASYETVFRVYGYDDVARWVMGKGKVMRNGKPLRMLGVFVDVTERHHVEQQLRELGGRLINAHEQERRRLSRELHDDVGQRVALLMLELAALRRQLGHNPQIADQLEMLCAQADETAATLHRLSHELHPAMLDQLGLAPLICRLSDNLSKAHSIRVDPSILDVPSTLNSDVALCLYRIAQEALHNVVKHSRASNAKVTLQGDSGEIMLSVVDDGVGFDPSERIEGLGLISMRERARLVRGRITVASRPGRGTQVEVRAPLWTSATS